MWKRIVALFLLLAPLFPIRLSFVDAWTVHVHDEDGVPATGISIEESWDSNTFNINGYSSAPSDASGTVLFPTVRQWRPIGVWTVLLIRAQLNILHGSTGYGAEARVFDDAVPVGAKNWRVLWGGQRNIESMVLFH
jgi:hypothetical protein